MTQDKNFNDATFEGDVEVEDSFSRSGLTYEHVGDLKAESGGSNSTIQTPNAFDYYKIYYTCGPDGGGSGSFNIRIAGISDTRYDYTFIDGGNSLTYTSGETQWFITQGDDRKQGIITLQDRGFGASGYGGYRPSISHQGGYGNQADNTMLSGGISDTTSIDSITALCTSNMTMVGRVVGIQIDGGI